MSKHTPGPWAVFRRDGYSTYIHAINEGDEINTFQVASCHSATSRKYFPTRGEAEANARLIAAAPELLEALQAMLRMTERHATHGLIATPGSPVALARAAIKKAEGQA
jgi:hypothetical protein